jgi:hypothetical protein
MQGFIHFLLGNFCPESDFSSTTASVADPGCLSRIRLFPIPDPNCLHPGSRIRTVSIPEPGSSSKNLSILTPKKAKKWFLSSKKYDLGYSSRILDPDADFLPSRISQTKPCIKWTAQSTVVIVNVQISNIETEVKEHCCSRLGMSI